MSNYSPQVQKLLPILQKQKLNRTAGPCKRHVQSQHENKVEVRTDTITSLLHYATQRSLWPYSLYFAVRSLTANIASSFTDFVIYQPPKYHHLMRKSQSETLKSTLTLLLDAHSFLFQNSICS